MSPVVVETVDLVRRVVGTVSATLIDGVNLKVNQGEFLAITGPSGSGKSSLLYLLGLLDAPTTGEIYIRGQATSTLSDAQKAELRLSTIGFVFQFHFLLPEFTALRNVMLPMRALGRLPRGDMEAKAVGLLRSLGLDESINKLPSQLSGGQRQRVAIARALANDPPIIMADEPTGNLDTVSTEQVFSILREVARDERTVIVVTHDLGLAARADRCIRIVDGRIAGTSEAKPAELVPA